ncbi:hypothetical protein BGZ89_011726 [Linnemannia elongata]|nr:hypothetical protein BGZ89_011726 [Linnemannia elongata]
MDEYQTFQCGSNLQPLAVRWDTARQYHYSRLKDVQEVFPNAVRFKRRGIIILYMEDENEETIEPRRIMHYPGDIIEVVTNASSEYNPQSFSTTHMQGMISPNIAAAAVVPGIVRPRPLSSPPLVNNVQVLTSPPMLNNQPVFSPPPPSSLPAPSAELFAQLGTTQRSPLPPQHHFPSSYPSPEPDFEIVEKEDTTITCPIAKKEDTAVTNPVAKKEDTVVTNPVAKKEDTVVTNPVAKKEDTVLTNPIPKMISVSNDLRHLIENSNGTLDEETGKIALTLTSSPALKQFFKKLVKDAKKTRQLDVTLDYNFGASDSEHLVNKIYKTDIALLRLDLKGAWDEEPEQVKESLNFKYHKIHTLLWDKNLKGFILENATYFGLRANLPPAHTLYSGLRLLHFLTKIESSSESHLCKILLACPNLHDLRLGNFQIRGQMHPKMEVVIGNLKKLKTLHIYNTAYSPDIPEEDKTNHRWKTIPQSDKPIKNIVRTGYGVNQARLQVVIGRSAGVIEVLMLQYPMVPGRPLELRASEAIVQPYAKLTHLDLQVFLSPSSLAILRQTLPQLNLIHLGINSHSKELLNHVNFETLESISLTGLSEADLNPIRSESLKNFASWKLKTIRLRDIHNIQALMFLLALPMRRIFLSKPSLESLKETLAHLDFSELEVLSILTSEYDWSTEGILAAQAEKFNDRIKVELCRPFGEFKSDIYDENARPLVATKQRLARGRVEVLSIFLQHERYMQAILPAHSIGN